MQIERLQGYSLEELIPIVAELSEKYTGGESTSISYEKVQQLMGAVIYCLRECGTQPSYERGYRIVLKKTQQLRELYNGLTGSFNSYGNRCLHDTVELGIPEFLRWYDARFHPQQTILTLDYPVLKDLSGLTGIDAVLEFCRCVAWEQAFLSNFDCRWVTDSLEAYSGEYQELVENLCTILLPGIVGHVFLKKPLQEKGYSAEEYACLADGLSGYSRETLIESLREMIGKLVCGIFPMDTRDRQEVSEYLSGGSEELAVRIERALKYDCLEQIFRI